MLPKFISLCLDVSIFSIQVITSPLTFYQKPLKVEGRVDYIFHMHTCPLKGLFNIVGKNHIGLVSPMFMILNILGNIFCMRLGIFFGDCQIKMLEFFVTIFSIKKNFAFMIFCLS